MLANILIVDDNKEVLESLELLLKVECKKVDTISNPNLILKALESNTYDIIMLDMNFSAGISSGNEGIYWMNRILKYDAEAVIVMITAYGDVELAVKAIKLGATDFVQKPWNSEKLIATLRSAYELRRSKLRVKRLEDNKQTLEENIAKHYPPFIGESEKIKTIFNIIRKIARTDTNVLILGENGTGKELIAREIHSQSKKVNEVFVSVDLASLSESLFESELFGHKKGAFTDAHTDRKGRFEAASGGTLFLDEIGNLSNSLQAKLLTSLQNREITPIGSNKSMPIDIRLISATNKDLSKMITDHLFREDLLYRINTVTIELPPLRERAEDILLLSEHFLMKFIKKYEKPHLRISTRAISKLKQYNWPGNVRELEHTIENAVILCESNIIQPDDIMLRSIPTQKEELLNLEEVEKVAVARALEKHFGNHTAAARELGISRTTLYLKIKKYGL